MSLAPISRDEERVRHEGHGGNDQDVEALAPVLDATIAALDGAGVEYLFAGGIASSCMGRERWTHDIDVFTRPGSARSALGALEAAGFTTEETYPEWLYKGVRDGQLVDVLFRSGGAITLDDEMVGRAPTVEFLGRRIRAVPPEDLVVIKAIVAAEHAPRHWHDALAILASTDLDWEYLMRRARRGIRRVLSLLLYAQSDDLPAPSWVTGELFRRLEGG